MDVKVHSLTVLPEADAIELSAPVIPEVGVCYCLAEWRFMSGWVERSTGYLIRSESGRGSEDLAVDPNPGA